MTPNPIGAMSGVALAALLVGCASAPPASSPDPVVPLAAAWQAPLPHGGATNELAGWWTQFNDPVLTDLQLAAQRASPSLSAARARIQRARATLTADDAGDLPRLDAVGSGSLGRPLPGQPTSRSASLGLQASWERDLLGAFGLGADGSGDAAQARLEAAQAGWHDARVSVAAEVAGTYTALRACEAQLVQSQLDVGSRSETARLTEQSAQAGFTAPADAALVRAGVAQTRSQMLVTQTQCETLVKGLVEVTDLPEADLRQRLAPRRAQLPAAAPLSVSSLPAALLAQRPDLAEAARHVVAAAGDQAQSETDALPRVSLSGTWGGLRLSGGGSPRSQGATWSVGPLVVSFPLFDGGARAAATQAARADYDNAVAQYQALARRAVREVETALVTLDTTQQREVDALSATRGFEASLVATQARQRGGLASVLDLEVSRRNALQAQSALIELQRERTAAWIALYRALGGGWDPANLAVTAIPAPAPAPGPPPTGARPTLNESSR